MRWPGSWRSWRAINCSSASWTRSGHAAACAGLVCLDITEREGLAARATAVGVRLSPSLGGLKDADLLMDVQGRRRSVGGQSARRTNPVAVRDQMLNDSVIVRPVAPSTLAICPPLVIQDDDVDPIVSTMQAALA